MANKNTKRKRKAANRKTGRPSNCVGTGKCRPAGGKEIERDRTRIQRLTEMVYYS